ncbi:MAG: type II toxin-antitoxin system VapC family toxin [Methylocystis sp.]|nr:type II toxin-antitoxin system VapC family toxin [Methylocystis sp.]MCA3583776.1 type II toxin-antitoxin system VapC family toxin [Methylocystis sp.]MCA3586449.1 type II toxin-antitoxin system VapC family toxin [Methylocystis sp.]MCA3589950.1 type II toxin-antitoxin system VapC family toxin [Methylocystis sp.]
MTTDMLCDASTLVSLIVPEQTSEAVFAMIRNAGRATVSDFAFGEVCSAIAIRVRRREIDGNEAEKILFLLNDWIDRNAQRVMIESTDIGQATRFVRKFELGLRMPDALHLALAQRLGLPLATQDRRQAAAAHSLGLRVIQPLSG